MKSTTSIWSRSLIRLFRQSPLTTMQRNTSRRYTKRRLVLESLERREVFSTDLISAVGIGNATDNSNAHDIVVDIAGNSYTTGYFSTTTDFDPSSTHAGNPDILIARGSNDVFVAKYASDNSFVWAKRMGGDVINSTTNDYGRNITVDGSGNVYVTGEFLGSADFGTTTLVSTGGGRDGFLVKLNSTGTVQWANRWGTAGDDFSGGVGIDATGNVYALGASGATGNVAYEVLKFSQTGTAVWTQSIVTGTTYSSLGDMKVDASGNVFVCGYFQGLVDFDPGPKTKYVSSGSAYSGFVLKLTTAGKFGWVSPFVGQTVGSTQGYSSAQSLVLDGSGNVIVGGFYGGPVDFNPGFGTTLLSSTGRAFVTKLNSSGGLVWAKGLESDNYTWVNSLAADAAGNIYATGQFSGTVDFDPSVGISSRTTAGGWDVFVLKLDSLGNFGWAESFGGTGGDIGAGIAVDSSGDVYLVGYYQGTVDFDPTTGTYNLTNPGDFRNAFRVRLRHA